MMLFNNDCLEQMPKLEKKSVDLVVVDLPYGQTDCAWDSVIDLKKMWIELKRICKDDCIYAFFCTVKFGNTLINSNPRWFRYDLVWEKSTKSGFFNAKRMPLRKHEMIYIFSELKSNTYNPQMTKGKPYKIKGGGIIETVYGNKKRSVIDNKGTRYPTSILSFKADKNKLHPTQKPVKLCEWLIKTYSNKGDTVLDFTMGSGSTGIACNNTERKFIGIEKDKKIFETAEKRLKK